VRTGTHDPAPDRASNFFAEIARKYGRHPNLIYEIWNEPSGRYDWATIKRHHHTVTTALRSIDSRNLIIAGTQNWCRDVDVAADDPLHLHNVAYALHFYAGSHGQALRNKIERALRLELPIVVTEWGTCQENGNGALAVDETIRWMRFLEKHRIGYVNWAVSDKEETASALRPGSRAEGPWTHADLSPSGHLVRNHLRATGGGRRQKLN
jgi:endoglucanase